MGPDFLWIYLLIRYFLLLGFVQAYILHGDFEVIGALFSGMNDRDINTLTQMSPTDKSCYVYRSRSVPEVLVCLCNTEVEPEQSYSWVTQVIYFDVTGEMFAGCGGGGGEVKVLKVNKCTVKTWNLEDWQNG